MLVDTDSRAVLKFGESIRGTKRYPKVFYKETNSTMIILKSGSKVEIHIWQHKQIANYKTLFGELPPRNKTLW